jgi:hypothetical protein
LLVEVDDDIGWNVRGALGKAAIIVKCLEQHGERQTSGAGFMGEQRPLVV